MKKDNEVTKEYIESLLIGMIESENGSANIVKLEVIKLLCSLNNYNIK